MKIVVELTEIGCGDSPLERGDYDCEYFGERLLRLARIVVQLMIMVVELGDHGC